MSIRKLKFRTQGEFWKLDTLHNVREIYWFDFYVYEGRKILEDFFQS